MKTLIIAGTSSGAGKTTVALGLMAAFRKRGFTVVPFKVGPDYIDPLFHQRICGRPSYNLDGWMMGKEAVLRTFESKAACCDFVIIEGVMGLFDGYDAASDAGSTAQIAKWLGAPVILVLNSRSMARSAAAVVKGFETFDEEVPVAGVIMNGVGSDRHKVWLSEAIKVHCRAEFFGALTRDAGLTLPERHLGLTTERAGDLPDDWIGGLAEKIEREVDLDRLQAAAGFAPSTRPERIFVQGAPLRIGVARDEAFCFYYEENLDLLRSMGAELVPFSPMTDSRLPEGLDGLYFGGGYPEVHGKALSANEPLRGEIRRAAERGMPIYAECGGMMYLSRGLYDLEGTFHPLAGVFPFAVEVLPRREALGYVTVEIQEENLLGPVGTVLRGHEFHYSRIVEKGRDLLHTTGIRKRAGEEEIAEGYQIDNVYGSYVHLHFGAFPKVAEHLVGVMRQNTEKRTDQRRKHSPQAQRTQRKTCTS